MFVTWSKWIWNIFVDSAGKSFTTGWHDTVSYTASQKVLYLKCVNYKQATHPNTECDQQFRKPLSSRNRITFAFFVCFCLKLFPVDRGKAAEPLCACKVSLEWSESATKTVITECLWWWGEKCFLFLFVSSVCRSLVVTCRCTTPSPWRTTRLLSVNSTKKDFCRLLKSLLPPGGATSCCQVYVQGCLSLSTAVVR